MAIIPLSLRDVQLRFVSQMQLDSASYNPLSPEVLAASVRRAAGAVCPCGIRELLHHALAPLTVFESDADQLVILLEDTVEALLSCGDLSEVDDAQATHQRQRVFVTPPGFLTRQSGAIVLVGFLPDQQSMLPDDLERRVRHLRHLRIIEPTEGEDLVASLKSLGLTEVGFDAWLQIPRPQAPNEFLAPLNRRLDSFGTSGDVPGLTIIRPDRSVTYYRGRWSGGESLTGRYVGRRSQAYGSDLWCYVELDVGRPTRLMDLMGDSHVRAWDLAWQIQAAIDAFRGTPQRYRLRGQPSQPIIDLFSPVPTWVQRRLEWIGNPVQPSGNLISYCVGEHEVLQETRFLTDHLWMAELQR